MATRGEFIDPTLLPTSIVIVDSLGNTLTWNSTNSRKNDFPGTKGLGRQRFYVAEALIKNAATKMPVLTGALTVTVTAAAGTTVHYRVGPKNPTWEAIDPSTGTLANSTKYQSRTVKYTGAFTKNSSSKPGKAGTVMRFRAYKDTVTTNRVTNNIMPNWKSPLVIIKFIHHS